MKVRFGASYRVGAQGQERVAWVRAERVRALAVGGGDVMAKCFVCGGSCETGELLQSPIRELDNAIAASPYRISVNATAALRGIVATKSLHLEFCSCKKLRARIVLERSAVQLGLPFLEVLWAAAHAYIVIFDECQQAEKRGEGHVVSVESVRRILR